MNLIFGRANSKLIKLQTKTGKRLYTFSLLSGHSCPGAKDCKAYVEEVNGTRKLIDGPNAEFRCFSASQEALFKNVYQSRKTNFDLIKSCGNSMSKMTAIIMESLPQDMEILRIHVAGDMFTYNYLLAWCEVARLNPTKLFYAYTKSIPLLIKARQNGAIPKNLSITVSRGGKWDSLIDKHKLKEAIVVYSKSEAKNMGLIIDEDDSHALFGKKSFGLLIHGQGKKGSKQSEIFSKKKKKKKKEKNANSI